MASDPRLSELLAQWELLSDQGKPPSPEELCRSCPELLPDLLREIQTTLNATGTAPPTPSPTECGRFVPLHLHARGNLGEVYLARDVELRRDVALKRMQRRLAHEEDLQKRFFLEARSTGRLEHPGIVPIYGLGVDSEGCPYYAMRFVKGESLQEAIARQRPRRALLVRFVAVCQAMAYAHSRGVIHRDLKPANVMLGEFGETFVVDWGLARLLDEADEPLDRTLDNRPAATQGFLGTPAFVSPEQADGAVVGPSSDVYSLGATLYTILAGKPPVTGNSIEQILDNVKRGEIVPLRNVARDVDAALEAICSKAMALRPEARYASAGELACDLEAWLADEPIQAKRDTWFDRGRRWLRRHRTLALVTMASLFLLSVVLIVSTIRLSQANRSERMARDEADASARIADQQRDKANEQRIAADEARQKAEAARLAAEASAREERRQLYVSNVSAAQQAWQSGRPQRARDLLRALLPDPGQEDLRGFEWNYLWRTYHQGLSRTFRLHLANVTSLSFTPQGNHVVSGSLDGAILHWDRETGQPLRAFVADPDDRGGELGITWGLRSNKIVVVALERGGPAALDGRLQPGDQLLRLSTGGGEMIPVSTLDTIRSLESGPAGSPVTLEMRRRERTFRLTMIRRHVLRSVVGPSRQPALAALTPDGRYLVSAANRTVRLWDFASGKPLATFRDHRSGILSLAVAPNSKHVATGDESGVIRFWDVERRANAGSLRYLKSAGSFGDYAPPIRALCFSANSEKLIAGGSNYLLFCDPSRRKIEDVVFQSTNGILALACHPEGLQWAIGGQAPRTNLELWDPKSLHVDRYLLGHEGFVYAVDFTPEGEAVVSGGFDATPRLWDRRTGNLLQSFHGHTRSIHALAVSRDGTLLASGDGEGTVIVHPLRNDRDVLRGRSRDAINDLAFAPDNVTLFGCAGDLQATSAYLGEWDTKSARLKRLLVTPRPELNGVTFFPDGKSILVGESPAQDGLLPGVCRRVDVATGRTIGEFVGHRRGVMSVVAPPGSNQIVTAEIPPTDSPSRGEIIFWDVETRQPIERVRPHAGMIGLSLSSDGKSMVSFGFHAQARDIEGEVLIWDVASRKVRARLRGKLAKTVSASLSKDGKRVVTVTSELLRPDLPSIVQVWDVATQQPTVELSGHRSIIAAASFSADGERIWLGGFSGEITLHDSRTGKLVRKIASAAGNVSQLLLSHDGKRIAAAIGPVIVEQRYRPSLAVIFDADSGKESFQLPLPSGQSPWLAFSPDDQSLAATTPRGDLIIYDLKTRKPRRLLPELAQLKVEGGNVPVSRLAVSPDGKTLATGCLDQTIKLWDLATSKVRQTIPARGLVSCLQFSPDGKTLAWGTGNLLLRQAGGLTLYDLEAKKPRATFPLAPAGVSALSFTRDGLSLVVATDHLARNAGMSELWMVNVKTGKLRSVVHRGAFVTSDVAVSPDATKLAFAQAADVILLNLLTNRQIKIRAHSKLFTRFSFSPDGKSLVTASQDGTVKFWQTISGQELLSLSLAGSVESLAFNSNSSTLATGYATPALGAIQLWRANPVAISLRTWYFDPGADVAQRRMLLDARGELVEETFFDSTGARCVGPDGYHRYVRVPQPRWEDAKGNPISFR